NILIIGQVLFFLGIRHPWSFERKHSAFSGQRSVVSGQWSALSIQRSAVSGQPSVVSLFYSKAFRLGCP
ncbi:MAG: hypothetical protein F6J98_23875, partial [Moorea sp. SIO4G2]|nr:hypothetical protein [Moorena sp. SIO4G2]